MLQTDAICIENVKVYPQNAISLQQKQNNGIKNSKILIAELIRPLSR